MTMLIGLAGPAKVGKSTTAKALISTINQIDPNIKIDHAAFADSLYGICSYLTGVPVETMMDQSYKEVEWNELTAPIPALEGWTPRKFLQIVGTECFRQNVSQDFWLQCAKRSVSQFDIAIMADARFPNEYEFCDFVIELSRDGVDYARNHASAMPPPQEVVDLKLHLFPEINFLPVAKTILDRFNNI
jgi:hypothetical protein